MMQIDWDVGIKTHYEGSSHTSIPLLCSSLEMVWFWYLTERMDVVLISLHGKIVHFFPCEHKQRCFTTWFLCNFLSMFLLLLNLPVGHEFERKRARDTGKECWYLSLAVWFKWMILSGCWSQISPRFLRSGHELPCKCLSAYSEKKISLKRAKT